MTPFWHSWVSTTVLSGTTRSASCMGGTLSLEAQAGLVGGGRALGGRRAVVGGVLDDRDTRACMKRAVRTTSPVRVTSVTSTMPRPVVVSTRRPARVATIS